MKITDVDFRKTAHLVLNHVPGINIIIRTSVISCNAK